MRRYDDGAKNVWFRTIGQKLEATAWEVLEPKPATVALDREWAKLTTRELQARPRVSVRRRLL